jgi:integrase
MKVRLTERQIEAAKPGTYLWDTDLVGFGLKVNTRSKVFIIQKRPHKGAKSIKRWTLGAYGILSLKEARTQAKAILATLTLRLPIKPVLELPSAPFVTEIERYYVEHCLAKLKPTTAKDMRYMIDKHLIPTFGIMPLEGVTHSQVRSFHSTLGAKHPYRANRVLALLSKFFNRYAASVHNPCRGIEKFREKRRELNTPNLSALLDPSVHPAIRLLLLTGMRKSEVLGLRWEWVDVSSGTIRLPDSKTGQRTVYLSQAGLALLEEVRGTGKGWVFPGERGSRSHLVGLQKIWQRTLHTYGLPPDLRIHDLRHYYASVASQDISVASVMALLGHKDFKTTLRYIHLDRNELRRSVEFLGEKLLNRQE